MKKDLPPRILITAPSLDEKANVSGISTVVRQIIGKGTFDYTHFEAGSRDGESKNAGWLVRQFILPFDFYRAVKKGNFDVVHINTTFNPQAITRDLILVKAAKAAGKHVLLHVHGGKFLADGFDKKIWLRLAAKMTEISDETIVLSELERDLLIKSGLRNDACVLENAVTVENFAARPKRKNSIVFLGRMHESKGLNEIIEATRVLQSENFEFTFRAFGAGAMRDYFVAEMTKILGDRFFFGGIATGAAKIEELCRADIFVLPSRYGEGLPMALLEAMAARCICVAAEMASVGAVVENGVNGFLIEPRNAAQLTEKLKMILSAENDFANLREAARETVETRFNLRGYIEKLEKIYVEIIEKN